MLRGLCSNWKQPIFFKFDFSFDKNSFLEILKKIESCGLIPIATTCDYSPTNRALLKELKITEENPVFSNSSLKNPVFFFADFPHKLKLLRNHVLDQGIYLSSGYYLSKLIFQKILQMVNSDLKLCYKITSAH